MTNVPPPQPGPPGQPPQQPWGQQQPYPQQPPQPQQPYPQQPAAPTQPVAPGYGQPQASDAPAEPKGIGGLFRDAATLAATGLIGAVLFAIGASFFGFVSSENRIGFDDGFKGRLLRLTETVDVGDVALLGLALALLLLTPDPPGGVRRSVLLLANSVTAAVIAVYGIIRALTLLTIDGTPGLVRFADFVTTIGVAVAAFTIAFYAASESFMKRRLNR
jgi:hypothetical protein